MNVKNFFNFTINSINKVTIVLLVFTFLWTCFIIWNASRTGEESKVLSDAITDSIKDNIENTNKVPSGFQGTNAIQSTAPEDNENHTGGISVNTYYLKIFIRKSGHLIEYTILAFLSCLSAVSFGLKKDKAFAFGLLFGLIVAVSDETIQHFTRGRAGKFADVLIDFCGCIMGAFIAISVFVFIIELFKQLKNANDNSPFSN